VEDVDGLDGNMFCFLEVLASGSRVEAIRLGRTAVAAPTPVSQVVHVPLQSCPR
jgi:hypothetical protein